MTTPPSTSATPTSPTTAASRITVAKYHGLGNDFLVVLDPAVEPGADLARRLCDRHRGVGADGLIVGRRLDAGALSFRLFNADGSEAEMSGNGLRCLAHAALDAGLIGAGVPVPVVTPAGMREVRIERRGPGTAWAEVDMGVAEIETGPAGTELVGTAPVGTAPVGTASVGTAPVGTAPVGTASVGTASVGTAPVGTAAERCNVGHGELRVRVGNPHLVVAGPDPAGVDVATLGPRLQATDPDGLNVEFVALGPGTDELTMRVWERGVGETEACGTGSCAAAVAFHYWGRVGRAVTVHQPGGAVTVRIEAGGRVRLAGPSERVAVCTVDPPPT
jgi:diaminopimelate epimerase